MPFESDAIREKRLFKTNEDIWNEILWFVNKKIPELNKINPKREKLNITIGQDLWYNQFYNAKYITEDWMFELIEQVNLCMSMDIPISTDLMSCPVLMINYYSIIKQEIMAISNG